jgi:flagellar motor switch protein FliG
MTYLYEESMFLAYVRKKSVRKADERLLERARKLEAEAGRIRYQLKKNQKFQITFTEGDK